MAGSNLTRLPVAPLVAPIDRIAQCARDLLPEAISDIFPKSISNLVRKIGAKLKDVLMTLKLTFVRDARQRT
jgi:hypothetical protein